MKELRRKAEAAQSAKLHRLGAQGNLKKALKGEHARRKYAAGGSIADDVGDVEGGAPKPRLDRPSRGGKKGAGKAGTKVNVVIMQHPPGMGGGAMPPAGGPMPMAGPPPPMPHPMAPPMAGPPPMGGAGGPPMPMRKDGGRVARKSGGKVEKHEKRKHRADGGETDDEMERKSQQVNPNDLSPAERERMNEQMAAAGNAMNLPFAIAVR